MQDRRGVVTAWPVRVWFAGAEDLNPSRALVYQSAIQPVKLLQKVSRHFEKIKPTDPLAPIAQRITRSQEHGELVGVHPGEDLRDSVVVASLYRTRQQIFEARHIPLAGFSETIARLEARPMLIRQMDFYMRSYHAVAFFNFAVSRVLGCLTYARPWSEPAVSLCFQHRHGSVEPSHRPYIAANCKNNG